MEAHKIGEDMKFVLFALFTWAMIGGLAWVSSSKEPTTLDEKINGTKVHVRVFVDEKHKNVCYYRQHGSGLSCLPIR